MNRIFFSFAEEDHLLVQSLVKNLETLEIISWYFTRDSILGIPYTEQIPDAIDKSTLFVLIASKDSLKSQHVTKEIEQAYQRELPMLPILHGISNTDVKETRPAWNAMLGNNVYGNTAHGTIADLAQRIKQAIDTIVTQPPRIKKRPSLVWASDGSDIQIESLSEILFQTSEIKKFLESEHQFFISANKGLGKTFLLRHKRAQLQAQYDQNHDDYTRPAVHLVPEGSPYLDMMESSLSVSKNHVVFLSSLRGSKRLWSFVIRLSAILHFPDISKEINMDTFDSLAGKRLDILTKSRVRPTLIFRALLSSLSVNNLNRLLDKYESNLSYLFNNVHSGIYFFIDRVEMAIGHLPRSAWINTQAGLIEAAWDIMKSNNHVKVYTTIREEAFINYESDSKANMHTSILSLRYTIDQLRGMIDRLCGVYEGVPDFNSFVGIEYVENTHCRVKEDSFRYLHRHTVGRPRDLVIICNELSKQRDELTQDSFRDIVNNFSSNNIIKLLFREMAVFQDCLSDEKTRHKFFSLLPHNVLTRDEVKTICCQFNFDEEYDDKIAYDDLYDTQENLKHPFCELFNCGLIGIVPNADETDVMFQRFKQPHDVMAACEACLPTADYYLLHPSLQTLIHQHRLQGYQPFRFISIGQHYEWKPYFPSLIQLQKEIRNIPDSDFRLRCFTVTGNLIESLDQEQHLDFSDIDSLRDLLKQRKFSDAYSAFENYISAIQQYSGNQSHNDSTSDKM